MPFRRRRPLLRAAAVGGGAYMAGKHAQRGRDEAEADAYAAGAAQSAPAQPAPAQPSGLSQGAMDQLKQLAQLKDQGVLTEEEFAQQKQKLLSQM